MKKNRLFMMGTLAVMLAFGLVLAGCDDGSTSDDGLGGKTYYCTLTVVNNSSEVFTKIQVWMSEGQEVEGNRHGSFEKEVSIAANATETIEVSVSESPGSTSKGISVRLGTATNPYRVNESCDDYTPGASYTLTITPNVYNDQALETDLVKEE